MKTFKASHLVKKPAEVFAEARLSGAIIYRMNTNGEILEEFLLISKPKLEEVECHCHNIGFDDLSELDVNA